MSDFLSKLETSSLSQEAKDQLQNLYEVEGNTPALREAVSQAFQLQIEQTAERAGLDLANDPGLKQITDDYEQDVAVLMASFEETVQDQLAKTRANIHQLQPEIDQATADHIRSQLSS